MKKFILALVLGLFSVSAFAVQPWNKQAFIDFYSDLTNLELEISGEGFGHVRTNIPGDEGTEYWCLGGLQLYDKKSGYAVGTATDCLSGVEVNAANTVSVLPGFTFFNFTQPDGGEWTLMVSGEITVAPTTVPMKTAWGMDVTHVTGSSVERGNNTVVGGSGPFMEATGISRISGMVNMSNFDPSNGVTDADRIGFSCFFSIKDLELQPWAINFTADSL